MIAHYRPEIARAAEETVRGLKEVETRLELLRHDLAALCTVVGHPEAARIAVTPARLLGIAPGAPFGSLGSPFAPPLGGPGAAPWGSPHATPLPSPYAAPPTAPWSAPGLGVPPTAAGAAPFHPGLGGVGSLPFR